MASAQRNKNMNDENSNHLWDECELECVCEQQQWINERRECAKENVPSQTNHVKAMEILFGWRLYFFCGLNVTLPKSKPISQSFQFGQILSTNVVH